MGEGVRSWVRHCPYCKRNYRLTNWMRRSKRGWNYDAAAWENTHLLGCRARPAEPQERDVDKPLDKTEPEP